MDIANRPYTPYTGSRIAGLSLNEQYGGGQAKYGYDDARSIVSGTTESSPYLSGALSLIDRGAALNPYATEATRAFRDAGQSRTGIAEAIMNRGTAEANADMNQGQALVGMAGSQSIGGNYQEAIEKLRRAGTITDAQARELISKSGTISDTEARNLIRSAADVDFSSGRALIERGALGFDEAYRRGDLDKYMTNLADPMIEEANRDYERALNRQRANEVMTGAFGGGRTGVEEATLTSRHNENLRDIRGAAFDRAIGVFSEDQARRIGAGGQLGALAATQAQTRAGVGQALAQMTENEASRMIQSGIAMGQLTEAEASRLMQSGTALAQLEAQQVAERQADAERLMSAGRTIAEIAEMERSGAVQLGTAMAALAAQDAQFKLQSGQALAGLGEAEAGRALAGGQTMGAIADAESRRQLAAGQTLAQMNTQQVQDLMATGNVERVLQQAQLDFDYGQFLEARDWDINNLTTLVQALGALPKNVTTDMSARQVTEQIERSGQLGTIIGAAATIAGAYFTGGASLALGAGATAAAAGSSGGGSSSAPPPSMPALAPIAPYSGGGMLGKISQPPST